MTLQQISVFLKKNPLSTICAGFSVLLLLLVYFRSDALSSAEAELATKTALGERYSTNLNYGVQLKEHYEAIVAANKDIEGRFVRVNQLAQNLQYFYKLETDTGVEMTVTPLTQQVPPAAAVKKNLLPVAFSVSVQGAYPAVVEFLRRIENGVHISRVLSCTLNAAGAAGVDSVQPRTVTLSLNLELLGLP